jgi:ABC-type bacteriocin/lantibiotic exporter with double-glycine peptidase domain
MKRRFEHHLLRSAWTGLQSGRVAHLANSLAQALQHVTALVLVYLGARLIVVGDMTVGALVAASILSARTLAPMRQLALAWHQFRQAREAVRRLDELLAERAEASGRIAGAELVIKGRIQVEEFTFRYPGAATPALDGVSFEMAPGSMLGVAGALGSGKSTLVRLPLGVEVPESGRVLLDGYDLAALSLVSYRAQIGVVPQETHLFAGTIAENIAMGAADRTLARVIAAARFVGADEFIRRLPQGYETLLGERGAGLSLGQRQLLAVARAIVRNPRMLVLDEATSALDAATEAHLLANIRRAGSGRTVLVVTHRQAVLEACDRVLLLERGRIMRVDSPAELVPPAALQATG